MSRSRLLFGLALLTCGAPWLQGQSYQSAFTEVRVDRVDTPATYHGGVRVDAPSGAASLEIPLGPGIGERHLHFTPTLSLRFAPQFGITCTDFWYTAYVGSNLLPMSENVDDLEPRSFGSGTLSPGTFDLGLVVQTNPGGVPNQTSFSYPGGSGTALGTVPAGLTPAAAQALVAKFGLGDQIAFVQGGSDPGKTTPLIRMGSGGQLILGLRSPNRLPVPADDAYYPAQLTDEVCTPLNFTSQFYPSYPYVYDFPRRFLVVAGDVAYLFSYVSHRYITQHIPYLGDKYPLHSAHFVLTRMLNRFGEQVAFAYDPDGIGFTATWSPNGIQVRVQAAGTTSIPSIPSLLRGYPMTVATKVRVSYQGFAQAPASHLLQLANADSLTDGPLPAESASNQPGSGGSVALHGVYNFDGPVWGAALQDLQPIQVQQEATGETLGFTYRPSANQVHWGSQTEAPIVLAAVTFPNRRVDLTWAPVAFKASHNSNAWGPMGGPARRPSFAYGVTVVSDQDLPTGQTRVTTHDRVVPQMNWLTGPSDSPVGSESWVTTAFYDAVGMPDGQVVVHRFVEPGATDVDTSASLDSQFRTLAYLKHVEYETRYYPSGADWQTEMNQGTPPGPGSTLAYRIDAMDRFSLHAPGNPDGGYQGLATPGATRTRSWDRDARTLRSDETTDWDTTQLAWTTQHTCWAPGVAPVLAAEMTCLATQGKAYVSPAVQGAVEDQTSLGPDNRVPEWLFGRVAAETPTRLSDSTGFFAAGGTSLGTAKLPLARNLDPWFNTLQRVTVGRTGAAVTTTFTPQSDSGLGAALVDSVRLAGDGLASTGLEGISHYGYTDGYLSSISRTPNGSTTLTVTQTPDELGRPLAQGDPEGRSTSIGWDSSGRLVSVVPPGGEQGTSLAYASDFQTVTVTRGAEVKEFLFNGFGELVQERRKDGNGTWSHRVTGYDAGGLKTGETVWLPGQGTDEAGAWAKANLFVATPGSTTTTTVCSKWGPPDVDGNRACAAWKTVTTTTPGQAALHAGTVLVHDTRSRVTQATDPNGQVTQTDYPSGSQVAPGGFPSPGAQRTVTLAPGADSQQATWFQYDPKGRLVRVVDALGQRTEYAYDGADRLAQVQQFDAAGHAQTRAWNYEAHGFLQSLVQPESGTTTYSAFTVLGSPQVTDYAGRPVTTHYDALGRATDVTASDVSQTFVWDAAPGGRGQLAATTDGSVGAGYAYYASTGRLAGLSTTIAGAGSLTQTFGYDTYGNRRTGTTGHGTWTVDYDPASQLPTDLLYNGTNLAATPWSSYDPVSWMLLRMTFSNGAVSTFGYGPDQTRVATLAHRSAAGATWANWVYNYDPVGNLYREDDLTRNKSDFFNYDRLNRLTSAVVQSTTYGEQMQTFAYDAFGNRVSGQTQRVVAWSGADGNSTATTTPSTVPNVVTYLALNPSDPALLQHNQLPATLTNGASTGAAYNPQGHLTQVFTVPGNSGKAVSLTYDALGRVSSATLSTSGITERYAYRADGLRTVIQEWSGSTLQKTRVSIYNDLRQLQGLYLATGGSLTWQRDIAYQGGREVAEIDATGLHLIQLDRLGTPRVISDANGLKLGTPKYLPFGETLEPAGSYATAKGFTNHEQTDADGLIYMQARFFLPQYGRFLSPDPARDQHFEDTQSWNIFSYCRNNPVMGTDPTGLLDTPPPPGAPPPKPPAQAGTVDQAADAKINTAMANKAGEQHVRTKHKKSFAEKVKQKDRNILNHAVKKGGAVNKVNAAFAEARGIENDQAVANIAQALENGKQAHAEAEPAIDANSVTKERYDEIKDIIDTVVPNIGNDVIYFVTRVEGSSATVAGVIPRDAKPDHVDSYTQTVHRRNGDLVRKMEVAFWRRDQAVK